MASRMFTEYAFTFNKNFVILEGAFTVDSSQTTDTNNYKCSSVEGSGIKYVANQAAGIYKISLTDRYFKFLGFDSSVSSVLGTEVAIASLVNGTPYTIKTMGTSVQADWVLAGLNNGVTAAVGVAFTAGSGASGAAGTGKGAPMITSGVAQIQVYGDPNTTLNPAAGTHPYFYIQSFYTAATNIIAPAAPVDGTVIRFRLMVRNSNLSIV